MTNLIFLSSRFYLSGLLVLLIIVIEIINSFFIFDFGGINFNNLLAWLLKISFFVYLTWLGIKENRLAEKIGEDNLKLGLILGLILAVFKIFFYHRLWTIFNLMAEPLILGLIAGGIGWIGVWGWEKWKGGRAV